MCMILLKQKSSFKCQKGIEYMEEYWHSCFLVLGDKFSSWILSMKNGWAHTSSRRLSVNKWNQELTIS